MGGIMDWFGHQVFDPVDIETRFSNEDAMLYMASIFTEPSPEALEKIERVRGMLHLLPDREADFVELYYFRHINQTDIAEIFGVSQPTVCYRLQRATKRLQFLLELPDISKTQLTDAMTGIFDDDLDVQIMLLMWETTCQSEAAGRLGVSQGLVRHRFLRSVRRLKGAGQEEAQVYVDMFEKIASNLNILREVRRPAWDERFTHVIYDG